MPEEGLDCLHTAESHPPGRARMAKCTGVVRRAHGVVGDLVTNSFKVSVFKWGVSLAGLEHMILQRGGRIGFHDGGAVFLEEWTKIIRDVDPAGVVDWFVRSSHKDGRRDLTAEKDILPGQFTNLVASQPTIEQ